MEKSFVQQKSEGNDNKIIALIVPLLLAAAKFMSNRKPFRSCVLSCEVLTLRSEAKGELVPDLYFYWSQGHVVSIVSVHY